MSNYWKNKKVLITGASGFIGSNACAYFVRLGSKVTGVVSPTTNKQRAKINLQDIEKLITLEQVNLLSTENVEQIVKGMDVIFHFAGIDGGLHFKKTHSADIFSHNMRINLNILESGARNKIKDILIVSSADIYTYVKSGLITENSPIEIDLTKEIDGYKLAKWATELATKEYNRQFGTNYIVVRPSNIYGPRDEFKNDERARFIPAIIKNVLSDKSISLWGNGKQTRSFLYIDDFLSICAQLIEKKVYNLPLNIASSQTISLRNLATRIMELSGHEVAITTDTSKSSGVHLRAFNLSHLHQKIGEYTETSLDEGLRKTIEFYKKYYF